MKNRNTRNLEGSCHDFIEVISGYLPGGTELNYGEPQDSRYPNRDSKRSATSGIKD
jgi:hypothetical protein